MGSQCSSMTNALKEGFNRQTEEISHGCMNLKIEVSDALYRLPDNVASLVKNIHVPYIPLIMGPFPWLLNYFRPPYNRYYFILTLPFYSHMQAKISHCIYHTHP